MFQWTWLEQAIERQHHSEHADQFNSIHERLIEAWKKARRRAPPASRRNDSKMPRTPARWPIWRTPQGRPASEPPCSISRPSDCAMTAASSISTIAKSSSRSSSIPGNGCFTTHLGSGLQKPPTRWIEPPWKAILSNKGILPLVVGDVSGSSQSAAGLFRGRSDAARLGASFVRKPLYSREGANVALISAGVTVVEQQGPYGAEGFIRQAFAPLPNFSGQYPVLGSWLIDHVPCGLSIREDENPITGNTSRFLPHAIL